MRWNWIRSDLVTNNTAVVDAEAVDPNHPVFRGVPLTSLYLRDSGAIVNAVQIVDPTVGTGITSFPATMDMGNGRLIAKPAGLAMGWIVEWDAGVEFYPAPVSSPGANACCFVPGRRKWATPARASST